VPMPGIIKHYPWTDQTFLDAAQNPKLYIGIWRPSLQCKRV
jgi:hypothetical protein